MWVFINGITGFFARTDLEFISFNVTSFHLQYFLFLMSTLQCSELCSEECHVYICIIYWFWKKMHEYMRVM